MPKRPRPPYLSKLKPVARRLRIEQTSQELILWEELRRKQILGVQFYRQKPIDRFVVDFCASSIGLVVELDGAQHFTPQGKALDKARDARLMSLGFQVLRFSNHEVDANLSGIVEMIGKMVKKRLGDL